MNSLPSEPMFIEELSLLGLLDLSLDYVYVPNSLEGDWRVGKYDTTDPCSPDLIDNSLT